MDAKQALGIVTSSLEFIQSAGKVPGVNLIPYYNYVSSAAGLINELIELGQDAAPAALKLADTFKKDAPLPSEADIAEAETETQGELAKLRAMPPKEDGEPD
jgi:hypothetical protein